MGAEPERARSGIRTFYRRLRAAGSRCIADVYRGSRQKWQKTCIAYSPDMGKIWSTTWLSWGRDLQFAARRKTATAGFEWICERMD
jgi:hypothetical protein